VSKFNQSLIQSLALPILACAFAFSSSAWGQGASIENMSMTDQPSYDGVERAILNPKTNSYEMQRSWLMFDSKEQVRVVNRNGGQFKIPYRSIKTMEFSFYNPLDSMKASKHSSSNMKLGGKRYLTVHYDLGSGVESTILSMQPDQYQQILGSFQAKTGMMVVRPGGYEKHW
jgi:hypothetical protein